MPSVPYFHVDAFTAKAFGGNQAAVMVFDEWPDDTTMQRIAAENMFAETAFLVRDDSDAAEWKLRWFAPSCEIRLCGHATLASGHAMLSRDGGDVVRFRTRKVGVLTVQRDGDGYAMALPAIPTERSEWPDAVAALGKMPQEIATNPDRYAVFRYADRGEVEALSPDFAAMRAMGDHQFICTAQGDETGVVSRVFVPGAGVDEDSVTGSAHAVLTPFWAARLDRPSFTAHQASRRGGTLTCRLDGSTAWLGGPCVTVVEGTFSY